MLETITDPAVVTAVGAAFIAGYFADRFRLNMRVAQEVRTLSGAADVLAQPRIVPETAKRRYVRKANLNPVKPLGRNETAARKGGKSYAHPRKAKRNMSRASAQVWAKRKAEAIAGLRPHDKRALSAALNDPNFGNGRMREGRMIAEDIHPMAG